MAKTQGRRGRPSKPYVTSWDESIHGLRREQDGRWRIIATRETFAEPDERRAVQRFRQWEDRQADATIQLPFNAFDSLHQFQKALNHPAAEMTVLIGNNSPPKISIALSSPAAPFWSMMRKLLIENPQLCAEKTGLPELLSWHQHAIPAPPIKLERLKNLYSLHSHAKPESKDEAARTFQTFLDFSKAETLDDLTTERMIAYREHVKLQGHSAGTVAAYFGRVKNIIRFGKSEGENAPQIDAALSRLAILKAPPQHTVHNPTPISPKDFQAIYTAAANWNGWQCRLLIMLNCCLHFDECLDCEWTDFNLDNATFVTNRNKRGRVIRAATLWPNTLDSIKTIKRTGSPYLFTSNRGTRFHAKGQWKTWNKLRIAAKCSHVQLDDLRDGAYTAAAVATDIDEKFARLLAGHSSHGLQDVYVRRNAAVVKPACDSVYQYYFHSHNGTL